MSTATSYMKIAMSELGQKEYEGAASNPRIVEYHSVTTLKATDDETPWCAAFVNWVLHEAGEPTTDSAAALSFIKWGTRVTEPAYGDLVIFDHGHGRGHVGFYVGSKEGKVGVLGGNQSNSVNVTWFSQDTVAQYRRIKRISSSTTVAAAAAVAAVNAGNLATIFTEKVSASASTVVDVASNSAGVAAQVTPNMDAVTNFLLLFVPPAYQPIVQAAVTLAGMAWIVRERQRKLRDLGV